MNSGGSTFTTVIALGGAAWTPEARRANAGFQTWAARALACLTDLRWFPEDNAPFCPMLAERWMKREGLWRSCPISLIGFSAGCVAVRAIASELGSEFVKAIVAVDGWCVPFHGLEIPVYRLSHDRATHENGLAWGGGRAQFYADPGVGHLCLWGDMERVTGWRGGDREPEWAIAADFLRDAVQGAIASRPAL